MAKFGAPGAGGQMTFEGYLAMAAHLAHLKSVFEWNANGQSTVTLNFHQFVQVGTGILP